MFQTFIIAFIWNKSVCVVTKVARLFLAPTSRLETLWRHISISSVDRDCNPSSQEALFCRYSWVPSNRAYLTYGIPDAVWERRETAELGSWRHTALWYSAESVFHWRVLLSWTFPLLSRQSSRVTWKASVVFGSLAHQLSSHIGLSRLKLIQIKIFL